MATVKTLLAQARAQLAETETPSLDARLLLQHATGLSHSDIIAEPERAVADDCIAQFDALVARRAAYEPVTRILGMREFFGRTFKVTPDVLDPRADTETIVDVCLELMAKDNPLRVLDLGTGSGILIVSLLAERNQATGLAVDISEAALAVARYNATMNLDAGRVQFVESDWFSGIEGQFDLIVSNPPYIPEADILNLDLEVKNHDPHLALVGGADGLECYRDIATGADRFLNHGGSIVVEIGAGQAADVTRIFEKKGFACMVQRNDLGGHIRCLAFQRVAS